MSYTVAPDVTTSSLAISNSGTSDAGLTHPRSRARARRHHPRIGPRKQRCQPEVRGPQPDRVRGKLTEPLQQAIAGGSELMQRRVHDDVVAADVQQREIEPQTGVETRADLGDRSGDVRARDSYVDDVGVRIVGCEQAGDGLLGQRRTDTHTVLSPRISTVTPFADSRRSKRCPALAKRRARSTRRTKTAASSSTPTSVNEDSSNAAVATLLSLDKAALVRGVIRFAKRFEG